MFMVASTPLDDFLADAGSAADAGETLQRVGLVGSLGGIVLATGLLVFLAVVLRGDRREVRILLRTIGVAGFAALVGAAVEIAGVATILDEGWSEALTSSTGSAAMMRLLAGLLIVLGLFDHTVPVGGQELEVFVVAERTDDPDLVRWYPSSASAFGLAGAAAGVLSFSFDGHTVTEGPRLLHAAANVVHVTAAGIWVGGIVGLAMVALIRHRSGVPASDLVVRFSSVATVALVAVVVAGAAMSWMVVDGLGDYTGTEWGRVLLVKTGAVAVAIAIGAYNHFVVVPAMDGDTDADTMSQRARTAIVIEAVVLLFVVVVTVFLVGASTN